MARRSTICALSMLALTFSGVSASRAQQATPPPASPRDVEWYEVDRMKGLTLSELNWRETRRFKLGDVTVIAGEFDAFDWSTFSRELQPITLRWLQRAALFLPPDSPDDADDSCPCGVIASNHDDDQMSEWAAENRWERWAGLGRAFGIPVMVHGWRSPEMTRPAGFGDFHPMQFPLLAHLLDGSYCEWGDLPLDGSLVFNASPLTKADLVANTLFQRLVEAEGGSLERIGAWGGSKEGQSLWTLAAIDDRLDVVGPGGMFYQDMHALADAYRREWGGEDRGEGGIIGLVLAFSDWAKNTELGRIVDRTLLPVHFTDEFYPRVVLVWGDVAQKGMHDGTYALGAETPFLNGFRSVPWYYFRSTGGNVEPESMPRWSMVADLLVNEDHERLWPKVVSAEAEADGRRRVRIRAAVRTPELSGLEVRAWTAKSHSRWWTEVEGGQWDALPMAREGEGGTWVTEWSEPVPDDLAFAFIVEARVRVQAGDFTYHRVDTSQPQFLWQKPAFDIPIKPWGECNTN